MTPGNAITIRPAVRRDAADLAIIDNLASHGLSLAFWQHAVSEGEAEDALSHGRSRFADPENFFGWTNAFVAESQGLILGAATAYVMPAPDASVDEIKRVFPAFAPVFELFGKVQEHWFLDSVGVFEEARGSGIGGRLIDRCIDEGRELGCALVSLVVEDSNQAALSLYRKRGFETVDSRPFADGENPGPSANWLLMTMELSG